MTYSGQVLPMVGNFIFVRPELLPGFLIKLNIKNESWALFVQPELKYKWLPLLIAPLSSHTIGNTSVVVSLLIDVSQQRL